MRPAAPGLSLLLLLFLFACRERPAPASLVVLTLDTVRADHWGAYGYPRATTPSLDAFAAGAVLFTRAFAQQTNTGPSHASMFTGLYPHVHGSQANVEVLPPGRTTLAQVLRRNGFRTAGFVSGVPMEDEYSGLGRGFEVYGDDLGGKMRNRGDVAVSAALQWLRSLAAGERFFLFVHLYDAHGPYIPPKTHRALFRSADPGPVLPRIPAYQVLRRGGVPLERLNEYVDYYDGLLRYEDDLSWRLLSALDLETTIVVVLADHGETLGERWHVLDHGAQVHDEQIRIPLLVRAPGLEPGRRDALVETVDLLPTALELLQVPAPQGLRHQGRSLAPLLRGEAAPERSFVFASARAESSWHGDRGYRLDEKRRIHTVRSRRWKLIAYPGVEGDYHELYDLEADPGETRDVAAAHPREKDALLALLERWLAAGPSAGSPGEPGDSEMPRELREKLRSLGYVE